MKLVEVVNCLLIAGAYCHDLDIISNVKGHRGSITTFRILHTLGYPVELGQLDVNNAVGSEIYKRELEKLSKWHEVETRRIKTLKEICAMRVKRNLSRSKLNAFIGTIELRPEIREMFELKHVDSKSKQAIASFNRYV